jgi:hypothetical protein
MSEDQTPSKASQLNALRALHKIEKQKKGEEAAAAVYGTSNQSVKNSQSSPFRESQGVVPRQPSPIRPTSPMRESALAQSAYNVQLKKAEDKEFFKMREDFGQALIKLESLDTRDLGLKDAQQLISKHRNPKTIRLIFSSLHSRTNISNVLSKEAEILLLGHTARIFGPKLIDSLDNPPSFTKTIFRLLELMQTYFKYHQDGVKRACAKSWSDIYNYCFKNAPNNKKHFFLIQPLVSMIKGGSLVVVQETACQVLLDLIRLANVERDSNFIDLVIDDCFDLFLTMKGCQLTLLKIIAYLTVHSNFEMVSCYIYRCFEKIVCMLDEKEADHLVKVEICKFLAVLGQKLIDYRKTFIGLSTDFVIKRIVNLTTDRIARVQMSAREALRIWKRLETQYEEMERMKMRVKFDVKDPERVVAMNLQDGDDSRRENLPPLGPNGSKKSPSFKQPAPPVRRERGEGSVDSLEGKRTMSSKQNSIARGAEVFKSNNIVEKTYLKQRAHNFQKKRTGTGGGFLTEYDKKGKKRSKSTFNEMREKFKQQIMHDKMSFTRKNLRDKYQNNHWEDPDAEPENDAWEDEQNKINTNKSPFQNEELTFKQIERKPQPPPPQPQQKPTQELTVQPPPEPKPQVAPSPRQAPLSPKITEVAEVPQQSAPPRQLSTRPSPQQQLPPPLPLQRDQPQPHQPQQNPVETRTDDGEEVEAGEEEQYYDGEEEEPYDQYDETIPADKTVKAESTLNPAPSVASLRSTVYYGQSGATARDEISLADTRYYEPQAMGYEAQTAQKEVPIEDDKTVECESVSSKDSAEGEPELDELVIAWNQALLLLRHDLIEEAYKLILSQDDDLYLIRLMTRTGPCYDLLEPSTANDLRRRVIKIGKTDVIKNIVNEFLGRPNIVEEAPPEQLQTINLMNSATNNSGLAKTIKFPQEAFNQGTSTPSASSNKNYIRVEENTNPFLQISQHELDLKATDPLRAQCFVGPMPPQSEIMKGYKLQHDNLKLSQSIAVTESMQRSQMEKLQKEAAEVYEMLRKQL